MIGIITQPLGYNYGGILQNFALQRVLKKLGHESITIDNTYKYSSIRYFVSRLLSVLLKCLGNKRQIPPKPYNGRSIPKITGDFIFKNIHIGSPCDGYSKHTIKKYHIDTIIVGSDQVWRPAYNESIYNMFLDFVPSKCKKIAYAASFGTSQWEFNNEETTRCKHLLKLFTAVSVREKSGINLIEQNLDYTNVKFVLDPTLLLHKDDYLSLCKNIPVSNTPFLCAYILDKTDEKMRFIHNIARKKGLEVRVFSAHNNLTLSVEEWLCTFRDASFVVTDSFHGTVFSIIFEREFIVLRNEGRGSDRFTSLLSVLKLLNRIYSGEDTFCETIQWNKVKKALHIMQQKSELYLKNNL